MTRGVILLGWFFLASYGQITKHDFNDPILCEQARKRAVAMVAQTMTAASAAKRVDPQCTNDPAPPINATVSGDLVGTFTQTPTASR